MKKYIYKSTLVVLTQRCQNLYNVGRLPDLYHFYFDNKDPVSHHYRYLDYLISNGNTDWNVFTRPFLSTLIRSFVLIFFRTENEGGLELMFFRTEFAALLRDSTVKEVCKNLKVPVEILMRKYEC